MKDTNVTAQLRTEDFGSTGSRRVLAAGRIPAVIYGRKEPVHITLEAKEFQNKLRFVSESTLLNLKIGRKTHSVLMKELQENVLLGKILHVDFFEVSKDEVVRTRVQILLTGHPEGAKFGGVLEQVTHEIEIECLPADLPRNLSLDVSSLNLNESLQVGHLELPSGVKALTATDVTLATVKSIKEEVVEEEEEMEREAIATEEAAEEESEE
ncbi:MAG: 50S ribosomal protein L25 [Sphaerochaetaceae bacterium]